MRRNKGSVMSWHTLVEIVQRLLERTESFAILLLFAQRHAFIDRRLASHQRVVRDCLPRSGSQFFLLETLSMPTNAGNRLKFTQDGKNVLISDLRGPEALILDAATRKEVKRINRASGPV